MVQFIPPPDTRALLPPLLACLPTAFASPRPPPALLPLLSPILRQRVQLLSSHANSSSDSWLPLLCWNASAAEELPSIIESDRFELHPVSGDVEVSDIDELKYRRLDNETLQARVVVSECRLGVIYLWCEGDQGGGGAGWRVSEVLPWPEKDDGGISTWWTTITEAEERSKESLMAEALRVGAGSSLDMPNDGAGEENGGSDDDDDDDYWAQYDNTPRRTPAKQSPALGRSPTLTRHARTTTDADYYEQYAQVQPALDNDDPSEDRAAIGESSLNGNTSTSPPPMGEQDMLQPRAIRPTEQVPSEEPQIDHPQPSSSPADSAPMSRLEDSAVLQSLAEVAIRQHISTSMKSLFRLARGSGIERDEFEILVQTELDMLGMLAEDE
ncbi:MAG: hypothetical protein FRX48_06270 [Lasallia pustulata]|uniref:Uncharacterized protein n=1 Tax=Lasallia pustulata TaxID=136370 RepID=A0A5M8PLA2_9LECA|nr:MAG: hypothetical protein FRX48_06270 [Lasallia pustulata]